MEVLAQCSKRDKRSLLWKKKGRDVGLGGLFENRKNLSEDLGRDYSVLGEALSLAYSEQRE